MLQEWLKNNPSKGLNGKRWSYKDNLNSLHSLQIAHHNGTLNLYETIEAYDEQWVHPKNSDKFWKKPETRNRNDLPPVYIQWKDEYRKRVNGSIQ